MWSVFFVLPPVVVEVAHTVPPTKKPNKKTQPKTNKKKKTTRLNYEEPQRINNINNTKKEKDVWEGLLGLGGGLFFWGVVYFMSVEFCFVGGGGKIKKVILPQQMMCVGIHFSVSWSTPKKHK